MKRVLKIVEGREAREIVWLAQTLLEGIVSQSKREKKTTHQRKRKEGSAP